MDHIERYQEKVRENQVPNDVFEVGDLVRLHTPVLKAGAAAKFHQPWRGPFRVLKIQESNMLLKEVNRKRVPIYVHMDRCKLIVPRAKRRVAPEEVAEILLQRRNEMRWTLNEKPTIHEN